MNNRKIVKQKAIINPIKLKVKTNNKKIENPKIKKIFQLLEIDSDSNEEKKLKIKKIVIIPMNISKKIKKKFI